MLSRDADYAFYLYTCNRCRGCTYDGSDEMRSICSPHEKFGFFSYSGGGKGYVAQGILEGKVKPTEETVHIAMNCLVCGACHHMCPPGFETISFIRDLRDHLVQKNLYLNKEHRMTLDNMKEHGNPWGIRLPAFNKHLDVPTLKEGMELALYIGCREHCKGGTLKNVLKILDNAGVKYGTIKDEQCCGAPLLELGNKRSFERLARSNNRKFNKLGVDRILTFCPHCASTLTIDYMDIDDLEPEVVSLPRLVQELLDEGRISFNDGDGPITVTYHDPCHLGRFLDEYDPPREALQHLPGLELVEMERTKNTALCCGAGGMIEKIVPELADFAGRERIKDLKNTETQTAITACSYCVNFLQRIGGKDLKIKEFAEFVAEHLE